MLAGQGTPDSYIPGKNGDGDPGNTSPSAPTITLPKGGGAIRGTGEEFAANPVTGTGFTAVPLAKSLGWSGFGPPRSLNYDSGAGLAFRRREGIAVDRHRWHRPIPSPEINGSNITDIRYPHPTEDGVGLDFQGIEQPPERPAPTESVLAYRQLILSNRRQPMCYISIVGEQKPHLLVKTGNNLAAETHVHDAPSAKFYLADKATGNPWIRRLPSPFILSSRRRVAPCQP